MSCPAGFRCNLDPGRLTAKSSRSLLRVTRVQSAPLVADSRPYAPWPGPTKEGSTSMRQQQATRRAKPITFTKCAYDLLARNGWQAEAESGLRVTQR
jgi:hypothetical protein